MDVRERSRPRALEYDTGTMRIVVSSDWSDREEDVAVVARFEVCRVCQGKGKHVNPSVDAHGISAEEFAEDPGFRRDYEAGMYDVTCSWCRGARVELVPDENSNAPEVLALYQSVVDEHYADEEERAYERRMGY